MQWISTASQLSSQPAPPSDDTFTHRTRHLANAASAVHAESTTVPVCIVALVWDITRARKKAECPRATYLNLSLSTSVHACVLRACAYGIGDRSVGRSDHVALIHRVDLDAHPLQPLHRRERREWVALRQGEDGDDPLEAGAAPGRAAMAHRRDALHEASDGLRRPLPDRILRDAVHEARPALVAVNDPPVRAHHEIVQRASRRFGVHVDCEPHESRGAAGSHAVGTILMAARRSFTEPAVVLDVHPAVLSRELQHLDPALRVWQHPVSRAR